MKQLAAIMLAVGVCLGAQAAPFQNLDFESASLPVVPAGQEGPSVPIRQGLPGWSASLGTNVVTQVLHNSVTLGSPAVLIWGPDWSYGAYGRVEGNFTAVLFAGSASSGPPLCISQTGLVPFDSQWLLFKGRAYPEVAVSVSLDGEPVPMMVFESYPEYSLYGGAISAFAGTEAELRFCVVRGPGNGLVLDSVEFSPVPEPGGLTLVALGLLAGVWRRRVRSKRSHA